MARCASRFFIRPCCFCAQQTTNAEEHGKADEEIASPPAAKPGPPPKRSFFRRQASDTGRTYRTVAIGNSSASAELLAEEPFRSEDSWASPEVLFDETQV